MLERLQVGGEEAARARVAVQAIPARPLHWNGGSRRKGQQYGGQHGGYGSSGADYLTARIAS